MLFAVLYLHTFKVRSVSRIMRMYAVLRQERETVMQLKSFSPGKKIPQGLLSQVCIPPFNVLLLLSRQ